MNIKIGNTYKIRFNDLYPNDHFQVFMSKYIGRQVIITKIRNVDSEGYRVVHAKLKNPKSSRETIDYICWREYDFEEIVEVVTLPEELFTL